MTSGQPTEMKNQEIPPMISAASQEPQERIPGLVLLKAANGGLPVFIAHGIGDTAMGLLQLATQIQVSQPVYGIQAKGLDGIDEPLDRIEAMAEFHVDAIRRLQARGRYVLIGYSLGGLVMLEVARRLIANGGEIALLAMLDSYPDRRQLSLTQRIRLDWRAGMRRAASLLRAFESSDQPANAGTIRNAFDPPEANESTVRAWQRVKKAQYRALRDYRPDFYNGKVRFVRAASLSYFPEDPVPVWSHLVKELEVETVPGVHVEMLTAQVESLASVVGRYVKESQLGE